MWFFFLKAPSAIMRQILAKLSLFQGSKVPFEVTLIFLRDPRAISRQIQSFINI